MKRENVNNNSNEEVRKRKNNAIDSLVSGSLSSLVTTVTYQPLELLKTRIQLSDQSQTPSTGTPRESNRVLGRTTQSASKLVRSHGISHLWRGTAASLVRSVPGVGIYYASLNVMQTNFSDQNHRPDGPIQAFFFGLTARSVSSFILLPVTVIKVRYESGQYKYASLFQALRDAYLRSGWVGVAPTILRDSIFSGVYYMCYTKLKSYNVARDMVDSLPNANKRDVQRAERSFHTMNFVSGIVSGLVASLITNPIDVLKTRIQVGGLDGNKSMGQTARRMLEEKNGYLRFFDGLVPRSLRRTLIAASTWTFYEFIMEVLQ